MWVGMPEGVDAAAVVELAREEGVVVAGGKMSEVPGDPMGWGRRWVRISVSYCEEAELGEGVRRLGVAVERWRRGERAGVGKSVVM